MKKISLLVIVLFGLVLVLREQAVLFLFGKGIEMQMAASLNDPDLEDGLHVGFCGAGSPLPDPERSAPCTIIIAGEDMFLFDVGQLLLQFNVCCHLLVAAILLLSVVC